MSYFDPQNPGIGGLDELTSAEEIFLTSLAGLPLSNGDMLYATSGLLTNLAIGSEGEVLTVVSGIPSWEPAAVSYTDEQAQDAVGNAVGNGLDYDDTTGAISVDETELTTLVPYTGATNDLDLGVYGLRQTNAGVFSQISNDGTALKITGLSTSDVNTVGFTSQISNLSALFDLSAITATDKNFTFPDNSGTLALTSDIPAAGLSQPEVMARISIGF